MVANLLSWCQNFGSGAIGGHCLPFSFDLLDITAQQLSRDLSKYQAGFWEHVHLHEMFLVGKFELEEIGEHSRMT